MPSNPPESDSDTVMVESKSVSQGLGMPPSELQVRFARAIMAWHNRKGPGVSVSDKVNRGVTLQKTGAEILPYLNQQDKVKDWADYSVRLEQNLPKLLNRSCPPEEAKAKAFLEDALGPYSSANQDWPGTTEALCTAMSKLPDVNQAAIKHVMDCNTHYETIRQHTNALSAKNGTFQPVPALEAAKSTIKAGYYRPMGDLMSALIQHDSALAQQFAKSLVDSNELHVQAGNDVAPLRQLATLAPLLANEQEQITLTNQVMDQAVRIRDQARNGGNNVMRKEANKIILESVGRLALTGPGVPPGHIVPTLAAAQEALQNGSHEAVLNMVGTLACSGDPSALELAGQVVKSSDFKKFVPPGDAAESLLLVADAQTLKAAQSSSFQMTPNGAILDKEIYDASVFLINRNAGAGVADDEESAAVLKALRGVELLGKKGYTADATRLAGEVYEQQVKEIKAAGNAPQRSGPRPMKDRNDESMELREASTADEMLQMAEVLQSIKALKIPMSEETKQLQKDSETLFQEAVKNGNWQDAVSLSYLQASLSSPEDAKKPRLNHASLLMKKAEDELKKLDAKALEGPGPWAFLDAMDTSLTIASRDRDAQTKMCAKARELRSQVAQMLGSSLKTGDLDQERSNLEKVAVNNTNVAALVDQMNDQIDLAVATSAELNSISSHLNTSLRHNVNRFEGEVKTGLPQARAFCYSSGSEMTSGDKDIVADFALKSAFAVDQACRELVKGDFQKWDTKGTYLQLLGRQQEHWANAAAELNKITPTLDPASLNTARKAMGYDLRKMDDFQKGKSERKKTAYTSELRTEWDRCVKDAEQIKAAAPSELTAYNAKDLKEFRVKKAEEAYLTNRAQAHGTHPPSPNTIEVAEKAVNMLSARAGYLIEERMYQLLPGAKRAGWDQQNTALIDGTRPDIVLPLSGDKFVCLDATASKSGGHIFNKTNAWHDPQVTMAIEITYPSFDSQTLETLLLDKVTVDLDKMKADQKQAALQAKQEQQNNLSSRAAARDAWDATASQYKKNRGKYVQNLFLHLENKGASKTDMEHLATWSGVTSRKKVVGQLTAQPEINPAAVDRALKALNQVAKDANVKLKPTVPEAMQFLADNGMDKAKNLPANAAPKVEGNSTRSMLSASKPSSHSPNLPVVDVDDGDVKMGMPQSKKLKTKLGGVNG